MRRLDRIGLPAMAFALALWGGNARAFQIDLASGTTASEVFGGASPAIRAAEVTVVSPNDLAVQALILYGLQSGPIQVGARIYDASDGSLVASSQVTTGIGGALIVPVAATLHAGATYRVGFFLSVVPSDVVQVAFFDPAPDGLPLTPYIDSSGSLLVERLVYSFQDEFPSNTLVSDMPVMGLLVDGAPPVAPSGPIWDARAGSPGLDGDVLALAVFDDGTGPALYAGGNFTQAGDAAATGLARWNGIAWSAVGGGVTGTVNALAVFDDGNGPALYAGGTFSSAGGVTVNHVAKWDGQQWAALGSGLVRTVGGINPVVNALAVWDDGTGPGLYAGGSFTSAGGVPVGRIARWRSGEWSALGTGVAGPTGRGGPRVKAILGFEGTLGIPKGLYVGGIFSTAGGVAAEQVARWDGMAWEPLGDGLPPSTGVNALVSFDDGMGPKIYAGGTFAGSANNIIGLFGVGRWNGQEWSGLSVGLGGVVNALSVFNDGSGPALFAGGLLFYGANLDPSVSLEVTPGIARWNGMRWSHLARGVARLAASTAVVNALAAWNDGTGARLYAGGRFSHAGGETAQNIAAWGLSESSPVADAGLDRVLAAGASCMADVMLDGSGSSDPDHDPLSYKWSGDFGTAEGVRPVVGLGLGGHLITLTVDDGRGGVDSDDVSVSVEDDAPPVLEAVSAAPSVLWPPLLQLVPVTVSVMAADNCDAAPACRIVSVISNEPSGPFLSKIFPQYVITGDLTVRLRATRLNKGMGRVYTIGVACTDVTGNSSNASVTVPLERP